MLSISQKTIFAPVEANVSTALTKLNDGIITSSPFFRSIIFVIISKAPVQLDVNNTFLHLVIFLISLLQSLENFP